MSGVQLTLTEMREHAEMTQGRPVKPQGHDLREIDGKVVQTYFYRYTVNLDELGDVDCYRWQVFIDGKADAGGIIS